MIAVSAAVQLGAHDFFIICFNAITGTTPDAPSGWLINLTSYESWASDCHWDGEKDAIPQKVVLGWSLIFASRSLVVPKSCPVMQKIMRLCWRWEWPCLKRRRWMLGSYIASGQVYARVKRVGSKQLCQQTDDGSQDLEAYQFAYLIT